MRAACCSRAPCVLRASRALRASGAQAEQRLAEEVDRVAHYLDPSTEPKIREVAERELIARHMRASAGLDPATSGLPIAASLPVSTCLH